MDGFSQLCQSKTRLLKLAHDDTAPGVLQNQPLFQTHYLLLERFYLRCKERGRWAKLLSCEGQHQAKVREMVLHDLQALLMPVNEPAETSPGYSLGGSLPLDSASSDP